MRKCHYPSEQMISPLRSYCKCSPLKERMAGASWHTVPISFLHPRPKTSTFFRLFKSSFDTTLCPHSYTASVQLTSTWRWICLQPTPTQAHKTRIEINKQPSISSSLHLFVLYVYVLHEYEYYTDRRTGRRELSTRPLPFSSFLLQQPWCLPG